MVFLATMARSCRNFFHGLHGTLPKKGQPGREPIKDVKQIVRMQLDLQYLDIFRLSPLPQHVKNEKDPIFAQSKRIV